MRKEVKFIFLLSLILALPFVSAVEVIQVQEPQKPQAISGFAQIFSSTLFWGFVVVMVGLLITGIIAYFLIKWLIQFIKAQSDAFYQIMRTRVKLSFAQRRVAIKTAWWKFWKFDTGIPIRLVSLNEKNKPIISTAIGWYKGDFQSHEGNLYIAFNMKGNHYLWGFIPKIALLVIPNRKEMKIKESDRKGGFNTITLKNIPTADEILQFNGNEVFLYAQGISNIGYFYYPVLKTKDSKIVDLSVPIYASIQEVAINELLYTQTDLYQKAQKKAIDINPFIRAYMKTGDTNQNVEVPSGSANP
jgi:hypothetical protein